MRCDVTFATISSVQVTKAHYRLFLPVVSPAKQLLFSELDSEAHLPDPLLLSVQCPTCRGHYQASERSDTAELADENPKTKRTSASFKEM